MTQLTATANGGTPRRMVGRDDPPLVAEHKRNTNELRVYPGDRIGGGHRIALVRINKRQRGASRPLLRYFFISLLSGLILSTLVVLPWRWIDPPTTAFMLQYDSSGQPLMHTWLNWADIGSTVALAVVAAEDQTFASHAGFDMSSIRQSIEDYSNGESLRGASTISQQAAKNLFLWPSKSWVRKGLEAYFTVLLEATLSKRRILEIYLNVIELGPGIYGIQAASQTYFGKPPRELTDDEAALLAAVLPNPKRLHAGEPSEYVLERRNWIVGQMQRLRDERWLEAL